MEALSHITLGKFKLTLRAEEDLHLPAYKGSTLRGGFGYALKEVSCALKRQECSTCMLRDRCVYLYLFETPPPPDTEMMRLYPSAPHPFVIEPPDNGDRIVPQGGEFEFGLTLVGRALDHLPYFTYAFIHMGDKGLGRGRGRFHLEEIRAASADGSETIYHSQYQTLRQPNPFPTWEAIRSRCEELDPAGELTFNFLSPTRIKFDGRLVEEPQFHHLIRSLLRRLSSLSYFHCDRRLELDFRTFVARSQKMECVSSDLSWYDWDRYSNRQKTRMTLGGFVGRATFAGNFQEFLPLLAWGEIIHVGKAASFGLGRYEITR